MRFDDLKLNPSILSALAAEGYASPTPVQAASIPPILEGKDMLGCAQTGTGKTAAFALPILHMLAERGVPQGPRPVRALVLTPTRELALQISESFEAYGANLRLKTAVIFGGVGEGAQKAQLRAGVDILVATPGRLIDFIGQRAVNLQKLEVFVLDEADRMLDMGFIHDVRRICQQVPQKRQTLLFSATMPPEIRKLADTLLRQPVTVEVARVSSTAEKIDQGVYMVTKDGKASLLRRILSDRAMSRVLVFTRTKHGADRVRRTLEAHRIPAEAIHGNKSQNHRQRSLNGFKDGSVRVLVATDLAARGIDVDNVTHVINYDLPQDPETYVHRIGRTARAGASGIAVSLCGPEDRQDLRDIERLIKKSIRVLTELPGSAEARDGEDLPFEDGRETGSSEPDSEVRREESPRFGRGGGRGQGGNGRQGHGGGNHRSQGQERRPVHHENGPRRDDRRATSAEPAAGRFERGGMAPQPERGHRHDGDRRGDGARNGQGQARPQGNAGQGQQGQPGHGGRGKRSRGERSFVREYYSNR